MLKLLLFFFSSKKTSDHFNLKLLLGKLIMNNILFNKADVVDDEYEDIELNRFCKKLLEI